MFGPSDESEARGIEDRVRAVVAAGYDVSAPHGRVGLCDWSDDAKRAVCWPSDERRLDVAREIVATWQPQLAARRPIVIGFSNGGAFATLLAAHGLVDGCAFASLHSVPAGTVHIDDDAPARPILFVGARGASWEAAQIEAVERVFAARNWPRRVVMRDGGHGVDDTDLEMAISFAGGMASCRGTTGRARALRGRERRPSSGATRRAMTSMRSLAAAQRLRPRCVVNSRRPFAARSGLHVLLAARACRACALAAFVVLGCRPAPARDDSPIVAVGKAPDGATLVVEPSATPPADAARAPDVEVDSVRIQVSQWGAALPQPEIRRVLSTVMPRIEECRRTSVREGRAERGYMMFRFLVAAAGHVAWVNNVSDLLTTTFRDPDLTRCIMHALGTLVFPKPDGGTVEVEARYAFGLPP